MKGLRNSTAHSAMIAFIDDYRKAHGQVLLEKGLSIRKVLPIAPSTYHDRVARRADPCKLPAREKRDMTLKPEVHRILELACKMRTMEINGLPA